MDKSNTVYPCFFHTLCGECVFLMRQQWLYDSAIFNRSLPKLLNRLEYYWLRSYFYIHTVGEGVRWWYAIFGAKSQRPTCWTFYSWISNCFLNGYSCTNLLSLSRWLQCNNTTWSYFWNQFLTYIELVISRINDIARISITFSTFFMGYQITHSKNFKLQISFDN